MLCTLSAELLRIFYVNGEFAEIKILLFFLKKVRMEKVFQKFY